MAIGAGGFLESVGACSLVCRETPLDTLQRAHPGVPIRSLLQIAIAAPPR